MKPSPLFNRWLPGVTLLAWSSVLLYYYFSRRISSLLLPAFWPGVLIAGLVMVAMACCFLFLPAVAACCDDDRCGHPLGRRKFGRLLAFLVLLLPIGAAATFAPNQYSATAALNRGVITDASNLISRAPGSTAALAAKAAAAAQQQPAAASSDNPSEPPLPTKNGQPAATPAQPAADNSSPDDFLPKDKDGNIAVQVIDLLYAAQDSSLRTDFAGKTVETIGQLMPDTSNNPSGNRFKLMRMFMFCCAADAKPIAALVEAPEKPAMAEMSWVKVVGTVSFPIEGGRTIPVLNATKVEETPPPADTMLY